MAGYGEQEEAMEEVGGDELNRKLTQKNTLPVYGNKETMNINPMILSNIQGSAYFKEHLYTLKTFHEVVDEIFYKVEHLEPWEKGSRKLAGQVGMCGGVRGVAAGGIVSTAYCLLFKLFTLKLTRRQVQAMLDHVDSPYIRGLGFMYIRYCQPPADFWDWFLPYLDDPEEIDLKAGGGFKTTVGVMCRMMLTKLDWFGTMLPRISVSVSKGLEQKLKAISKPDRPNEMEVARDDKNGENEVRRDVWGEAAKRARTNEQAGSAERKERYSPPGKRSRGDVRESSGRSQDRYSRDRRRRSRDRRERSRSRDRRERSHSRDRRERSHSRDRRERSRSRDRRERSRSRDRRERSRSRDRDRDRYRRRSRSRDRRRSGSHSRDNKRSSNSPRRRSRSRSRERRRSRSRSRDRARRSRSHSGDRRQNRSRSKDRRRNRSRDRYTRHRSSSRDRKY